MDKLLVFSRQEMKFCSDHGLAELLLSIKAALARFSRRSELQEVLVGLIVAFILVIVADVIKARLQLDNVMGLQTDQNSTEIGTMVTVME